MSLSVITHTMYANIPWLERCKESVATALPVGAVHHIVNGTEHWAEKRIEAIVSDEFVALVDDDDTIDPRSLSLCLKALKESGAGVAVTTEVAVNADQSIISVHNSPKTYQAARTQPRILHHLVMFRASAVDRYALKLHNEFGMGVDWFMTCSAALEHGAIHVPINGYFWTIHPNSITGRIQKPYAAQLSTMSKRINETWTNRVGPIPKFNLGQTL